MCIDLDVAPILTLLSMVLLVGSWSGQVPLEQGDHGLQGSDADEGNVAVVHALPGKASLQPRWCGQQRCVIPHPG